MVTREQRAATIMFLFCFFAFFSFFFRPQFVRNKAVKGFFEREGYEPNIPRIPGIPAMTA
jgi:hypothetical protein